MSVVISIELLKGTYDAAAAEDRELSEWPPHPARLFCALVAAARTESECAALRWLEAQPAPTIVASRDAPTSLHRAYVVVNAVSASGGNQEHPGRTNGLRVRARALPSDPRVTMIWDGDPDTSIVGSLDAMARQIPYLGRSTGVALVAASATGQNISSEDGRVLFEPCDMLDPNAVASVRVPYPGYLDALQSQFNADRPAWEVSRTQTYRLRSSAEESEPNDLPSRSVYSDFAVFRFSGVKPQPELTVQFTSALRSAVLKAANGNAPSVLHGHGADGRPHVAFLALPDVGHDYADGHLLGLAVAVPELPAAERRAVLAAVLGLRRDGNVADLRVPGIGSVELIYSPGLIRPWGASPRRWCRGSRRWISATPMILDRYPKHPTQIEAEVCAGLRRVGLPEPVDIQISTQPLLRGAARLRPIDLPPRAKGRLFRHVAVTFDRKVSGPVLVGAGRYFGVGLMAPVREGDDTVG